MGINFEQSDDYKKIFSFHGSINNRLVSRESGWLEFKESFNWGSKDKYAKSMSAFANNKGGFLVFGVKDQPRDLVGLQNNNFEDIDEAKIASYLNSVFSPELIFSKFVLKVESKTIGILSVTASRNKPVICLKNDGDLRESDVYYRYNARSEKIKYTEFRLLIEQIKQEERKNWMNHIEKISKIGPENAAILNSIDGEISGKGGTLVIDKKLIPKLKFINDGIFREGGELTLKLIGNVKPVSVLSNKNNTDISKIKLTDSPDAPVFRIEEDDLLKKNFPLTYKDLDKILFERYSGFVRNNKFHKLRQELMKNKKLSRTRYLDPNNVKGSRKDFYSPLIIKEFDKYYTKK